MIDVPLWVSDSEISLYIPVSLSSSSQYANHGCLIEYEDLKKVFVIQALSDIIIIRDCSPEVSSVIKTIEFTSYSIIPSTLNAIIIPSSIESFRQFSISILCSDLTILRFDVSIEFRQDVNHQQLGRDHCVAEDRILESPWLVHSASCQACRVATAVNKNILTNSIYCSFICLSPKHFIHSYDDKLILYDSTGSDLTQFGSSLVGSTILFPVYIPLLTVPVIKLSFSTSSSPKASLRSAYHYIKSLLFSQESNGSFNYTQRHVRITRMSQSTMDESIVSSALVYSVITRQSVSSDDISLNNVGLNVTCSFCHKPFDNILNVSGVLSIWDGSNNSILNPIYEFVDDYNNSDSSESQFSSGSLFSQSSSSQSSSSQSSSSQSSSSQSSSSSPQLSSISESLDVPKNDRTDPCLCPNCLSVQWLELSLNHCILRSSSTSHTIALYRIKQLSIIDNDLSVIGCVIILQFNSSDQIDLKLVKRFDVTSQPNDIRHPIDLQLTDDTLWIIFPSHPNAVAPNFIRISIPSGSNKKQILLKSNLPSNLHLSNYLSLPSLNNLLRLSSPYNQDSGSSLVDQFTQAETLLDRMCLDTEVDDKIDPEMLVTIITTVISDIENRTDIDDIRNISKNWIMGFWIRRITFNGRFDNFVLTQVLHQETTEFHLSTEDSTNTRQSIKQSLKSLFESVVFFPIDLNVCSMSVTKLALEIIHKCNNLQQFLIQAENNEKNFITLCLSSVWKQFTMSTSKPYIEQSSLIVPIIDCGDRPVIIRQSSASILVPKMNLSDIWDSTLNLEIRRACLSMSQFESHIFGLSSLLQNSLEWSLLICSRIANNKNIRMPSSLIRLCWDEIINFSDLVKHKINSGDSMKKLSSFIFRYCMTADNKKWDNWDNHIQSQSELNNPITTEFQNNRIIDRLLGQCSNQNKSDIMKTFQILSSLIVDGNLLLPSGNYWDELIDNSLKKYIQKLECNLPINETIDQSMVGTIHFNFLISQLQHSYSVGFDIVLLMKWVARNLTATTRRFETVATTSDSHVWWDTKLGTGSGGFNSMGLRLGRSGQITEFDFTYESKTLEKIGQLRIIMLSFAHTNVPFCSGNPINSMNLFDTHPVYFHGLPSLSFITPSFIFSRILQYSLWDESHSLLSRLLDDSFGSGVVHYIYGISLLNNNGTEEQIQASFEHSLNWDSWMKYFATLEAVKSSSNSPFYFDSLDEIIRMGNPAIQSELWIVKGTAVFSIHCSRLLHVKGFLSAEKSFLIRAAKCLRKFRLLNSCGLNETSVPQISSDRSRHVLLSADILIKIESDLWHRVFLIACETGKFNEAAQLLSNADLINLNDAQKYSLDFLCRLLSVLESGNIGMEIIQHVFDIINQSNPELLATLFTYLIQLSLILNPTLSRGHFISLIIQRLYIHVFKNPLKAALHSYLLSAVIFVRLASPCTLTSLLSYSFYPPQLLFGLSSLLEEASSSSPSRILSELRPLLDSSQSLPDIMDSIQCQHHCLGISITHLESSSKSFRCLILPSHYFNFLLLRNLPKDCPVKNEVFVTEQQIRFLERLTLFKIHLLSTPNIQSDIILSTPDEITVILASVGMIQKSFWCCKDWNIPYRNSIIASIQTLLTSKEQNIREMSQTPNHRRVSFRSPRMKSTSGYRMMNRESKTDERKRVRGESENSDLESRKRLKEENKEERTNIISIDEMINCIDELFNDLTNHNLFPSEVFYWILLEASKQEIIRLPYSLINWIVTHPSHMNDPFLFLRILTLFESNQHFVLIAIQYLDHILASFSSAPPLPIGLLLQFDQWLEREAGMQEFMKARSLLLRFIRL